MRVSRFLLITSLVFSFSIGRFVRADVAELGDPDEVVNAIGALGTWQRGGLDKVDATFTAVVDFDAKTEGERELIWESGGGTVGASIVYEVPSQLVVRQAGSGGFALGTIRFVLPQDLIDGGDVTVAWAFDVTNDEGLQTLNLSVNGVTVASLTMALEADWTGSNGASFGVQDSTVAANGANGGITAIDFASGVINVDEGLKFYTGKFYCPATTDADGDGIADELEAFYGADLTADGDTDGDGISDVEEVAMSIHPTNADTDGDGLNDGAEIDAGTDPGSTDSDGDGVSDGDEVAGGTDPLNADSDGDGFDDGLELVAGSDPNDPESVPDPDCDGVAELGEATLALNEIGAAATLDGNNNGVDATFSVVVDFEEKLDGDREVIFETGAGTIGISMVYEAPNTLVLRSDGNGGFSLLTIKYLVPASIIAAGDVNLVWTYDVDSLPGVETLRISINNYTVASGTMDLGGDFSGSDPAAFGAASGNLAGTGANSGLTGVDFTSGVINVDEGFKFYGDTLFCPAETDSDGDGLADEWEMLYSADLATLGADADADGDGLNDADELARSTDPTVVDTDGDGLNDGDEVAAGLNPVGPNMVGHWTFDGTLDSAVSDNDGTYNGGASATFGSGWDCTEDGSISLNGTDEFVQVAAGGAFPIYNQASYSVAMWVKGPTDQRDLRVFSESNTQGNNNPLLNIGTDSSNPPAGLVDIYIRDDAGAAGANHIKSAGVAFDGTWHHIAWVDDNGSAVLYIDGVQDATDFTYTRGTLTLDTTTIGGILRANPSHWFTGSIDDVRVYDYAISAEEVAALVGEVPNCAVAVQYAGDCNGDGVRNISDVVCSVGTLYSGFNLVGLAFTLPCDGDATSAGNVTVLDVNGDGVFDAQDALYQANALFANGPPPAQGESCFPILEDVGCSDAEGCL